jgi:hypothetical protein
MATNPDYVLCPELQMVFVNKTTGLPLVDGSIVFFSDLNRTVPKDVFEQSGSPPNYTYTNIGNTVTLGAAGTPTDGSGNDFLIYLYPFDANGNVELYFIQVFDSGGNLQFTRQGIPPGVQQEITPGTIDDFNNLITNGSFLFNIGTTGSISTDTTVLAPSASQGLVQPDWYLSKNNTSATDSVTFNKFSLGSNPVAGIVTPLYYLTYNCSNIPSGETSKNIISPIAQGVNSLEGQTVTVSFVARSINLNTLSINFLQHFGSGGSPSADVNLNVQTFTLTSSFVQYSAVATIPSTSGKTLGSNGDDYLAFYFGLQLNAINTTDIYNVQVLLGNQSNVAYVYEPQDQVAGKVFVPRTGDIRISVRPVADPNWVAMNDGTIGNVSSNATTRAYGDTYNLFQLIWNNVSNIYAPLYTSAGALASRGVSSSADYAANNAIALTKALGRIMSGANPNGTPIVNKVFTRSTNDLVMDDTSSFFLGTPVTVSNVGGALPSPLVAATTYYAIVISSTHIQVATTNANALSGTEITLTTAGSGTNTVSITSQTTVQGQYLGQESHTPIVAEMAAHSHTALVNLTGSSPTSTIQTEGAATTANQSGLIGSTGGGSPFNIIQPTTYQNIYIKL